MSTSRMLIDVSPMIHHLGGQAISLPAQLLQQRVNPLFVFIDEWRQYTERWKTLAEVTRRRTRSSRHLGANVSFSKQIWDWSGNETSHQTPPPSTTQASFPGLQSPNVVEGDRRPGNEATFAPPHPSPRPRRHVNLSSEAHKGVACVMNAHIRCRGVSARALLDAGMARYAGWRRRVAVAFHLLSVLSFVS